MSGFSEESKYSRLMMGPVTTYMKRFGSKKLSRANSSSKEF